MHMFSRTGWLAAATCAVLLGAGGEALAADGVVFVHGTGDQTVSSATSGYWTQWSIDTMRNGRPYLIVGYPGRHVRRLQPVQLGADRRSDRPVDEHQQHHRFTVITHSNGSSPVRYMLGHTGAVSANGNVVNTVTSRISQVIFMAPDLTGTPLANQVTTSGSFLNIANSIVEFFGGGSYNNPAVVQQRTDNMSVYNSNGTFAGRAGATTVGGKPISVVRGNKVYANLFSSDAYCAGYLYTIGLKAAALLGWGSFNASTDGFIGTESSGYFGNIIIDDGRLNHNQSRRSCHNSGNLIGQKVASAPIPPPSSQTYAPETNVRGGGTGLQQLRAGLRHGLHDEPHGVEVRLLEQHAQRRLRRARLPHLATATRAATRSRAPRAGTRTSTPPTTRAGPRCARTRGRATASATRAWWPSTASTRPRAAAAPTTACRRRRVAPTGVETSPYDTYWGVHNYAVVQALH